MDIGDVDAFKQALEKDGFTVQEGQVGFLDFLKLYDTGVMPSAYGTIPPQDTLDILYRQRLAILLDKVISEQSKVLVSKWKCRLEFSS